MPGENSALEVDNWKARLSSRQRESTTSANNLNVEQDQIFRTDIIGQIQHFQHLNYQHQEQ
jgi:hypothetical protein